MAIRYFSDIDGAVEELRAVHQLDNAQFRAQWPGVKGMRADGYTMWVGYGLVGLYPVTRKIEYKAFPSKHACNSKCLNGKHNGVCECQCGGKNHGAGMFTRFLKAA